MRDELTAPLWVKQLSDSGCFSGYASVFGVIDRDGEIVARGAFSGSLKRADDVKMLWQHDPAQPIGLFEHIAENDHGLFVRGRLLTDVARAREAHALMRAGAIDGLSIGFRVREEERDAASGVRIIRKADLWEISLVTFPANPEARIQSFKSSSLRMLAGDIRRAAGRFSGGLCRPNPKGSSHECL